MRSNLFSFIFAPVASSFFFIPYLIFSLSITIPFYASSNSIQNMNRLLFLGTGHAMPINSSCSSVLVESESTNMLLDCGGGFDILKQFNCAKKDPTTIQNIFITHSDSDHILGIVPLVRAFHRWAAPQKRRIFCSAEVKNVIDRVFTFVASKNWNAVAPYLEFVILKDGEKYVIGDFAVQYFDLQSKKTPQFSCVITFSNGNKLAFLGDEPLHDPCRTYVQGADFLIHNAFCLESEKETYKPREKNHSTVKEAAETASSLNAKTLILLHMEDTTLETRKKKYAQEAQKFFPGAIIVPDDLDTFEF